MITRINTAYASFRANPRAALTSANALVGYIAFASFVTHMLVAKNYGYFRDELYYLEDGKHLAFGYVDQPPLIGWLAWLTNLLFNNALIGIHLIAALAGAALIIVAGLIARELGGDRFAQALTAGATGATVVFMATASIFSMDILDALWWSLAGYTLVRLLRRNEPEWWLWFGTVAGIGLLTKLTMLFFGFAVVVGLLLTPQRAQLRTRWPWLGGAIAFGFLLPYIAWNAAHGWPTWEFWHHYGGLSGGGPLGFLANQLVSVNLLNLPLIIAGLLFYFREAAGKPYRALGWAYVVLYVLLTLINAKAYFLVPLYPVLYAGGAILIARAVQTPRWRWVRVAYPTALLASALLFAPLAMPVLPPATYAHTYGALTFLGNGGAGQQNAGVFPQYLGDRFGWDTLAATVSKVYQHLPGQDQQSACVFTANYGEASALDLYHARYFLPPIISGHNNFYLWGPGTCSGAVIITVGLSQQEVAQSYGDVQFAVANGCEYCMASEEGAPILIARQPRYPIRELWQRVKHFD